MQNRQLTKAQPDCSAITDEMLRPLIISKWPTDSDGKVRIPYTFFGGSRVKAGSFFTDMNQIKKQLITVPVPAAMEQTLRKVITSALNVWAQISNNKFVFVEDTNMLSSKGIRFHLVPGALMYEHNVEGLASLVKDNNGHLMLADVYFMDNKTFWQQALTQAGRAAQTIHHEIEHALGLSHDWSKNAIAMKTLRNIPEGMLCSVMPYAHFANTTTSMCKTNCTHFQAAYPGEIDVRLYQLTYEDTLLPTCYTNTPYENYQNNALDTMVSSAIVSCGYKAIIEYGKNISLSKTNQPAFSATSVHIVADACVLSALIYLDMPTLDCAVFTLTAVVKYAPHGILPKQIQNVIGSGTPTYAFNIIQGIRKGQRLLPATATLAASIVGTMGGDFFGGVIGSTLVKITNYVARSIFSFFSSNNKAEEPESTPILAQRSMFTRSNE